jgi:hypothetical protein
MNRRAFLLGTASIGAGLLLAPGLAIAETVADPVLRVLRKQGYRDFEVTRTWLGRVRITATREGRRREVILNKTSGEVLRDVVYLNDKSTSGFDDSDGDTRTQADRTTNQKSEKSEAQEKTPSQNDGPKTGSQSKEETNQGRNDNSSSDDKNDDTHDDNSND